MRGKCITDIKKSHRISCQCQMIKNVENIQLKKISCFIATLDSVHRVECSIPILISAHTRSIDTSAQ